MIGIFMFDATISTSGLMIQPQTETRETRLSFELIS